MPLRVEGPPRTDMKPKPWRVNPRYIAPEWRWAWEGMDDFIPLWGGGGDPRTYRGQVLGLTSSASWADTNVGVAGEQGSPASGFAEIEGGSFINPDNPYTIAAEWRLGEDITGSSSIYTFLSFGPALLNMGYSPSTSVERDGLSVWTSGGQALVNYPGADLTGAERVRVVHTSDGSQDNRLYVDGVDVTDPVDATSDSGENDNLFLLENTDDDFQEPAPSGSTISVVWTAQRQWSAAEAKMWSGLDPFGPFRRQTIRYTGGPTAGVVTITENITDTNTVDDTVDDTLTLVESLTSANVITDSVTEQFAAQVISESLSDQIVAADVLNENLVLVETLSDGFVVVDNLTDLLTLSETISDATVSADTVGLRVTNTDALTDTVSVTDTVSETISGVITEALTDALVATDAVSESQIMTESPQDVLSTADQLDEVAILVEDLTGDVSILDTITETVTSPGIIRETLTDNFAVSDTADLTATLTEQLSDDIRVLDTEADTAIFVIAVSDQATITDTASASGLIVFTVLDDRGVEIVDEKFNVEVLDSEFETESFDDDFEVE